MFDSTEKAFGGLDGLLDHAKEFGIATPLGRAGTADEVAEAVVWLLDDGSSYVAGAILDVTGGR